MLDDNFFYLPKTKSISVLFEKVRFVILFNPEIRKIIGPKTRKIINYTVFERLLLFLEILMDLAALKDYSLLNVEGFAFETTLQDSNRIDMIFIHINNNFERQKKPEEIADVAYMTDPSFCRYFKRSTGKTFARFVNEYRIVQERRLVTETTAGITDICYDYGFNNFSYFNKQFKEFTGKSASKYWSEFYRMLQ